MSQNLRRLEAQRNQLNAKVRLLREELQLLQEPGSYVGEVVKVMGKSKVLVKVNPEVPDSTYEMIGGLENQIKEIKEVIELPVKHPELFEALSIAQPKGAALWPTWYWKDTACRARTRTSIIFMDEIDSIGSSRMEGGGGGGGGGGSGGDSEVQRTMLELLNQLDGFEATQSIKVIMAAIELIFLILLCRIDRKIEFPPPNEAARADILKIHSRKMNLTRGIDLHKIAEQMIGASGAEVKGVCTEAGMYAL
ncbi:hypothetical protein BSLG_003829 [Batrachochytrium salamandrivorans]|nr:hypothetical protein BSLG_003829 [Batrachochytrium salamandrivorans]